MTSRKKIIAAFGSLLLVFAFGALPAVAKDKKAGEHKSVVKHLKTRYKAKKVSIPMMWLARFAVKVVRPAGVKSFSLTMFENLQFSSQTLDAEMQQVMKNSFGKDWSPIFHVRSREGQQIYMYMREAGDSIKMALVTVDKNQAAVIRAAFNPEKFAEFVNDPKIFGISLNDGSRQTNDQTAEPQETEKKEEAANDN